MHAKFSQKRYDVVAGFWPLDRHSSKFSVYRRNRFFATCSPFPCKVSHFRLSQTRGSLHTKYKQKSPSISLEDHLIHSAFLSIVYYPPGPNTPSLGHKL